MKVKFMSLAILALIFSGGANASYCDEALTRVFAKSKISTTIVEKTRVENYLSRTHANRVLSEANKGDTKVLRLEGSESGVWRATGAANSSTRIFSYKLSDYLGLDLVDPIVTRKMGEKNGTLQLISDVGNKFYNKMRNNSQAKIFKDLLSVEDETTNYYIVFKNESLDTLVTRDFRGLIDSKGDDEAYASLANIIETFGEKLGSKRMKTFFNKLARFENDPATKQAFNKHVNAHNKNLFRARVTVLKSIAKNINPNKPFEFALRSALLQNKDNKYAVEFIAYYMKNSQSLNITHKIYLHSTIELLSAESPELMRFLDPAYLRFQ